MLHGSVLHLPSCCLRQRLQAFGFLCMARSLSEDVVFINRHSIGLCPSFLQKMHVVILPALEVLWDFRSLSLIGVSLAVVLMLQDRLLYLVWVLKRFYCFPFVSMEIFGDDDLLQSL